MLGDRFFADLEFIHDGESVLLYINGAVLESIFMSMGSKLIDICISFLKII